MPDPKSPQKHRASEAEHEDPKGSEVVADARRTDDDLPRVHGHGWNELSSRDGREQAELEDELEDEALEADVPDDDDLDDDDLDDDDLDDDEPR